MNRLLNRIYGFVERRNEISRFKRNIRKKKGFVGRALNLLNSKNVHIGYGIKIKDGYRIECYQTFYNQRLNPNFTIEDGVIIGPRFTAFVADSLTIGKDTIFAGNVTLITENHGMNPESSIPYHAQELTTGPIRIGEGCWFGQNVSVLPNVSIGKKCIIATNAVVTSNVPDYSIAAGCPAKIIKKYNFKLHRWDKAQ